MDCSESHALYAILHGGFVPCHGNPNRSVGFQTYLGFDGQNSRQSAERKEAII